jgi:hypothetical protein
VSDVLQYSGRISKVTPGGQAAFVELDASVEGRSLAVISSDTDGRVVLAKRGGIHSGQRVVGLARIGPDALKAVTVSLAPVE